MSVMRFSIPRDIIYGDTSSGVSRIVQVLLSAFATYYFFKRRGWL